jgi:hypothetical protein
MTPRGVVITTVLRERPFTSTERSSLADSPGCSEIEGPGVGAASDGVALGDAPGEGELVGGEGKVVGDEMTTIGSAEGASCRKL